MCEPISYPLFGRCMCSLRCKCYHVILSYPKMRTRTGPFCVWDAFHLNCRSKRNCRSKKNDHSFIGFCIEIFVKFASPNEIFSRNHKSMNYGILPSVDNQKRIDVRSWALGGSCTNSRCCRPMQLLLLSFNAVSLKMSFHSQINKPLTMKAVTQSVDWLQLPGMII